MIRHLRLSSAAAALGLLALGQPGGARAAGCEVSLNVTDKDPAGPNVRATPGGAIIGR